MSTPPNRVSQLLSGSGLQAQAQDEVSFVLQAQPESDALTLPATDIKGFALGNALGSMDGYNATHSRSPPRPVPRCWRHPRRFQW